MDPNSNLIEFLDAADAAITESGRLNAAVSALRKTREEAEDDVNRLRKQLDDKVDKACEKRLKEIDRTYDGDIKKCREELHNARERREKALNQGIRERIEDETAGLRADIKAVNARTAADFKANDIPDYCGSRIFRALYFPDGAADIAIIIVAFAIAFFVIPYGLYKIFFDGSTVALVIIYVLDVLLFGGIYVGISRHTVTRYHEVLRQAGINSRMVEQNRKKIRSIIRRIENDTSEAYYDLAKYDDEIAHISQELADHTMQKNDAVNTFENVTRNIIYDEIAADMRDKIAEAERKFAEVSARFNAADAAAKQKAAETADRYESVLGREFMDCKKIGRLKDIVSHGTATALEEAIDEYNRQYDI